MRTLHVRIGVAVILCAAVIAAMLFAVPTTQAASTERGTTQVANAGAANCTWTVQRGEALYKIAARFGTTTAYLAQLNNLFNPNYIYSGMVLIVPCGQPQPQPWPQPQPQPQPQPGICTYYIVQRGDWLKTIAYKFGVSWQALAAANGLQNANYIYAGQRLVIPCAQPWPPPPPPPVCPGCPPCQGCPPPVYPTQPPPVCPGCPPCQGCPPPVVYATVDIRNNGFHPPVITVKQGAVVQWINRSNAAHTVTQGLCPGGQCSATPGGFNSGIMGPSAMFTHQFWQLGTFAYFDGANGAAGTVAVVP